MIINSTKIINYIYTMLVISLFSNIALILFIIKYKNDTNKIMNCYLSKLSGSQDYDALTGCFKDDGSPEHAQEMVDYYNHRYNCLVENQKFLDFSLDLIRRYMKCNYSNKSIQEAALLLDDLSDDQIVERHLAYESSNRYQNHHILNDTLKRKFLLIMLENYSKMICINIDQERQWKHNLNIRLYNRKNGGQ